MQKQQSSMFYDVRRTVMDKEKATAYQRAKANFKSKNPFFIAFMHPQYISRSCNYLVSSSNLPRVRILYILKSLFKHNSLSSSLLAVDKVEIC